MKNVMWRWRETAVWVLLVGFSLLFLSLVFLEEINNANAETPPQPITLICGSHKSESCARIYEFKTPSTSRCVGAVGHSGQVSLWCK